MLEENSKHSARASERSKPPLQRSKLRRQIAFEAAQLLYRRQETEYYTAKMKAARRICKGWVKPADLPGNAEIRDEVLSLTRTFERDTCADELREMRFEALRMMRVLANFKPKLIGSVLTGHIRRGSDIDLHVFCNSPAGSCHGAGTRRHRVRRRA